MILQDLSRGLAGSVRRYRFLDYLFLSSVALWLVATWFRQGLVVGGGDAHLPAGYYSARALEKIMYTWLGDWTGIPSIIAALGVPYRLFAAGLETLMPPFLVQATVYLSLLVLQGLSVYQLTFELVETENHRLAATLAGLFYMLNPFSMASVWARGILQGQMISAMLPLALLLCTRALRQRNAGYVFLICIVSLVFSESFLTPAFVGTFFLVLLTYILFHVSTDLCSLRCRIRFMATLILLWLPLNAWWIIPSYVSAPSWMLPTTAMTLATFPAASRIGVFAIFRLVNPYYMFETALWGPLYSSPAFQAISLIVPTIVFGTLLFLHRNRWVLYFSSLSLLGMFIAKAAAPPIGEVLEWLFTRLPIMAVYRGTYEKIGIIIALGYAFLFGYGLSLAYHRFASRVRLKERRGRFLRGTLSLLLILSISFSTLVIYVWPMWTGDVIAREAYVEVPSYYREADAWISSQTGDFRILQLPFVRGDGIKLLWRHGYLGFEPSDLLFGKPVISRLSGTVGDPLLTLIPELERTGDLWKIAAILNVKYIVLNKDIDWAFMKTVGVNSPELIQRELEISGDVKFSKSFGHLDFYELRNELFLPHVYASSRLAVADDPRAMLEVIQDRSFNPANTVLLLRDRWAQVSFAGKVGSLSLDTPQVFFARVDPTMYKVEVLDASGPFLLIFSETYSPLWKAYVDNNPIPEESHFIANGYANGWYVSKPGTYKITVEFEPQRYVVYGVAVSLATFMACFCYFVSYHFHARKARPRHIT
jgi:hypothetical protein